ncbi:MAG: TonB-dependent receptor [Bacteroidetes bacterium]|nr:TonB-dependent receptor [Bacteroidota bacterium]
MKTHLKFTLLLALIFFSNGIFASTTVSGTVRDTKGQPVPYANLILKDTYDGASADDKGNYSFTTDETGTFTLICHQVGFEEVQKPITLNGTDVKMDFVLKAIANELEVVTISAGTIEASDEKRTTVLKPLDIVTTAGGQGDIYGAVQTLPGATKVGEQEGLFVRGGTGNETKTIIDGLNVNNPFFSSVPDIASRGRFSPFLFKGTVFSTGGYSAQYGQALSSALVLETQDLPTESASTLAFSSVGIGAGHNHLWADKNMSAGFDFNYTNLAPYYTLVKQKDNYIRMPQFDGASVNFRKKFGETSILKFYGYFNYGDLALKRPDIDSVNGYRSLFDLRNSDAYTNLSFRKYFGDKWRMDAAVSTAFDHNEILANTDTIRSYNALSQGKLMGTRYFLKRDQFRFGAEYQYFIDKSRFDQYNTNMYDNYISGFGEADIYLGPKFVARVGGRAENSSLLAKTNVAPRVSLAMRAGKNNQLSMAYGDFYQKPTNDILYRTTALGFEKATHYILSFQHVDDSITLRVEAYYKKYDDLVTFFPSYTNGGHGYAQGFDVFWRDKKTFKNVDYWISYTYVDSKRLYRDFPVEATPAFVSTHNANIVIKKFFPKIMTSVGFTYTYSSGRPYYNPNNPVYLGDKTYDYHVINLNASYLTKIAGAFTVIVVSVTNVPGFNNVYGYRYSYDGARRESIAPQSKRTFFIGMFMSFGTDRRKDVINNTN